MIAERTGNPDYCQLVVRSRTVEPILVEVTRGDLVEARHRVHAVAVERGEIVTSAGDAQLVTFMRSAAKPIQALPVVRVRPDLDDAEVAVACASHLARPEQLAAVRSLLEKVPATEDELECGADPTPLEHNCSGKHAAMLAFCRTTGWQSRGYPAPDHPCQRAMLEEVAAAAEIEPAAVVTATDGCGVVTFGLPLERMAHAFARLPSIEGGERVATAMCGHPELIRGPLAADTMLMRALPGWVAKGGAEGLLCATSPEGTGIALKVEDGNTRAVRSALAALLSRLGFETGELGVVSVKNTRGEHVGDVRVI
jgi:L-asparaginase II